MSPISGMIPATTRIAALMKPLSSAIAEFALATSYVVSPKSMMTIMNAVSNSDELILVFSVDASLIRRYHLCPDHYPWNQSSFAFQTRYSSRQTLW